MAHGARGGVVSPWRAPSLRGGGALSLGPWNLTLNSDMESPGVCTSWSLIILHTAQRPRRQRMRGLGRAGEGQHIALRCAFSAVTPRRVPAEGPRSPRHPHAQEIPQHGDRPWHTAGNRIARVVSGLPLIAETRRRSRPQH